MTELLIGIVVGAVASGLVQALLALHARRVAGRVAARLFLGDLFIAEHDVIRIINGGRWPDMNMPTFERALETWRAHREAFAASVDATDWTLVAVAYRDLMDLPGVADAGRTLTADELHILGAVRTRLDDAGKVASEHAAPKQQRARVVRELTSTK